MKESSQLSVVTLITTTGILLRLYYMSVVVVLVSIALSQLNQEKITHFFELFPSVGTILKLLGFVDVHLLYIYIYILI